MKSSLDAERRKLLGAPAVQEVQPEDVLQESEDEYFERLRDLNLGSSDRNPAQMDTAGQNKPKNVCLNDVSSSSSFAHFSPYRGRGDLEGKERALMLEVQGLRQRLASQARKLHPASHLPDTQWT
ncbi:TBC1 domain family member 31-like [Pseudophryne corroboree]|uniref:TBC1 domain family member 31-like n=1 Tax=Pseudophryne corroboree TaxID=495146 RepID=UPI0030814764